ncbi:MAG TPA: DeoR/GlpR family DNA-binding transcription regulator [Acidimicrobiales bacterium]|nr:DeoR/GlpR family DNA-binding transcription regulator [Acidimicrobiales bacterium]
MDHFAYDVHELQPFRRRPLPDVPAHEELVSVIGSARQGSVGELAETFGVSVDTIRRDLEYLERRGLVTRTHGGAVPAGALATMDSPFAARMAVNAEAKQRIGVAAAGLLTDGQTIFVNGGTTTLAMVRALGDKRNLTVVTSNLRVPFELPDQVASDVYILGGSCRLSSLCTIGAVGFVGTGPVNADVAVIGVGGVSVNGPSTSMLPEALMMREMIAAARQVVILADSSKIGKVMFAQICEWSLVSVLVTDSTPPSELEKTLDSYGVSVVNC